MCRLAGFSRAGFYRAQIPPPKESAEQVRLRGEVQKVALEWPAYGSRRIGKELERRGWRVNRKRLQRILREDNLLCVVRRKFVVTTDSGHPLTVYPNVAEKLTVNGLDQLWIADITYIRLQEEFVYLAVVLDAHSRRVIGWHVDDNMTESLTLKALGMALEHRRIAGPLVHHSDRGVQYASGAYTRALKQQGIAISMSRKGNPWDNAACESFMKTLKHEEVHRSDYRNLADARSRIGTFLEAVYNQRRLHSSLNYRSPAEFERDLEAGQPKEAAA
jgi:transposase InsO family protein